MKMTFRWSGSNGPVTLQKIRQIPLYTRGCNCCIFNSGRRSLPQGKIDKNKAEIAAKGLEFEIIESVPVHEEIEHKRGHYQLYLDNYSEH